MSDFSEISQPDSERSGSEDRYRRLARLMSHAWRLDAQGLDALIDLARSVAVLSDDNQADRLD